MTTALRVFYTFFSEDAVWHGLDSTISVEIDGKEHVFDSTALYMDDAKPFLKASFLCEIQSRIYLDLYNPILSCDSVVSRGTRLWRAREAHDKTWPYLVKDTWRHSERPHEGEILDTMGPHSGVVRQHFQYQDVIANGWVNTTSNIRYDLDLSNAVAVLPLRAFFAPKNCLETQISFSNSAAQELTYEEHGRKRKPSQAPHTPTKRIGTDFKAKKATPHSREKVSRLPKPYSRTHGRLFMRSVGHPLETFETATPLLRAIRDALSGHQGLQSKAILHRDISSTNIVISSKNGTSCASGFLIDLDHAIYMDSVAPTGPYTRTGTPIFMAIALLENPPARPSYFHDLQSFFYVLLWIVTNHDVPGHEAATNQTRRKRILSWKSGTLANLLSEKQSMLLHDVWGQYREEALQQPGWKPLYQPMAELLDTWYDICFPEVDVQVQSMRRRVHKVSVTRKVRAYKHTQLGGLQKMYVDMSNALDSAIKDLRGM